MAQRLFPRPLYTAVRVVLAGLFVWAGTVKLMDPRVFAVTIKAFGIAPEWLITPASHWLPVLEIALGLGLLCDVLGSLAGVTGLLLFFIAILAWAIHLGLDIDCGCYGPTDPESKAFGSLATSLWRDLAMLTAAAWLYAARRIRSIAPREPLCLFTRNLKEHSRCAN